MTDIDTATINDRLAREVMGWEGERDCAGNGHYYYFDDTDAFSHLWIPCDNIRQMEMCWRRMQKRGWDSLTQASWILEGKEYYLHYYRNLCKHRVEGLPFGEAKGADEALVGCKAMIAALDAEKEGKCQRS